MYLSNVHIVGFRNFKELRVQFHKGLNVIVGENNVGKTNLLDAIRIALGGDAFDGFPMKAKPSDRHRDADGNVTDRFEIHLTFSEISQDDMSAFIECLVFDAANPKNSNVTIHYRWTWNEDAGRYSALRWGGSSEDNVIRSEVLQGFPATYLEPLRDALGQLVGGRSSRVAQLLERVSNEDERADLEALFRGTNEELRERQVIKTTVERIEQNLRGAIGPELAQKVALAPAAPTFTAIAQSLRIVLQLPLGAEQRLSDVELLENGLGYNNLLFIAAVLGYRSAAYPGDVPLLFVEEPEAHLHPQLQTLLVDYLVEASRDEAVPQPKEEESKVQTTRRPQVFITTHSPVLAAHVEPDRLIVMHSPVSSPRAVRGTAIGSLGLTKEESRRLHRLLDVTKSSLLFSRGIIFVEGISELLVVPELAKRLGKNLGQAAVSVIALHGLGFEIVSKLFGTDAIDVRCAIVTDADPPTHVGTVTIEGADAEHWTLCPKIGEESSALAALRSAVKDNARVEVFSATVTLEYDLAAVGDNAMVMAAAWPDARGVTPRKFTVAAVEKLTSAAERARLCWQAICLQEKGRHKAAFAHELASRLADPDATFSIPQYLADAVAFVFPPIATTSPVAAIGDLTIAQPPTAS